MANFLPPANGASQGNYFLPKSHKLAVFEEKKNGLPKQLWQKKLQTFSNGIWFWLDERSFWPSALALPAPLRTKKNLRLVFDIDVLNFFCPICSASREIIGVKVDHRQTGKFFDTIYGGMWIFLSVKFATSLLASLAGGLENLTCS